MHCNPVFKKALFFIALSALFFSACKRNDSGALTNTDDNGGYASDASRIEWINNDVISLADAAGNFYNGQYMRGTNTFGNCAIVGVDTLNNPHVLTINFPSENCPGLDGKNRRGSIIVTYNGE